MPARPKKAAHAVLYVEVDPAARAALVRQALANGRTLREQVERLIWRGEAGGPDPKPVEPPVKPLPRPRKPPAGPTGRGH